MVFLIDLQLESEDGLLHISWILPFPPSTHWIPAPPMLSLQTHVLKSNMHVHQNIWVWIAGWHQNLVFECNWLIMSQAIGPFSAILLILAWQSVSCVLEMNLFYPYLEMLETEPGTSCMQSLCICILCICMLPVCKANPFLLFNKLISNFSFTMESNEFSRWSPIQVWIDCPTYQ